jgi:hypothetical protein
VYVWW